MAVIRNAGTTLGVGEPGKGWVIQPSIGLSFLPRLVYMDGRGEGWKSWLCRAEYLYPWGGAPVDLD